MKAIARTLTLTLTTMLILSMAPSSFGHEGHDHDQPTTLNGPKGGDIKSLEQTKVEVLLRGKEISINLYDKNLQAISTVGFKLEATTTLPKAKKQERLNFTSKENSFVGSFDAKGAHRFTLNIKLTDPKTKHADALSFILEPKN